TTHSSFSYSFISSFSHLFFFNDTAPTEIYTLSLHDALPIFSQPRIAQNSASRPEDSAVMERKRLVKTEGRRLSHDLIRHGIDQRSEEHTSELQSRRDLVCRLLLEKKKKKKKKKKEKTRQKES